MEENYNLESPENERNYKRMLQEIISEKNSQEVGLFQRKTSEDNLSFSNISRPKRHLFILPRSARSAVPDSFSKVTFKSI
jgi:hypothetical protein